MPKTNPQDLTDILVVVDEFHEKDERKRFLKTVEQMNVQEARECLVRYFDAWHEREKKYMATVRELKNVIDELTKP